MTLARKKAPKKTAEQKAKMKLSVKEKLMKAMAHPMRVRILAWMNDRPWSPNEISQEIGEGLSQISYHVKVLKDFELIEMTKTEPRRGAVEHFYKAIWRAYMPSKVTKQFPKSAQRMIFFDTLKDADLDIVASLDSGRFDERDDYHVSYTPGDMDAQGRMETDLLNDKYVDDYLEIEARSAQRRAKRKGEGRPEAEGDHIPTSAVLIVFGSDKAEQEKAPSRKRRKKKK